MERKERMKENLKIAKGITLISLIVTIIILLILAGITLNFAIGENGIFRLAQNAGEDYTNAQEKELADLERLYSSMQIATNDNAQITVSVEDLKNIIKEEVKKSSLTIVPAGTVISYMGNNVPTGYLACDGTQYKIEDYKNLAEQIKAEFGRYDYYGGDGETTFSVPDLRGEFLRGTGTAQRNTGSGATVGSHQDSTYIPTIIADQDRLEYISATTKNDGKGNPKNQDKSFNSAVSRQYRLSEQSSLYQSYSTANEGLSSHYGIRPTNTSVLYCIKY